MLSFQVNFVQTDKRTDGWTDLQMDRPTNGQMDNGKTMSPRSFDTGA